MTFNEGGGEIPPSVPSLATIDYRCTRCGWSYSYPVVDRDLRANRSVPLWIPCPHCGRPATTTGLDVQRLDGVGGSFDMKLTDEDIALLEQLGVKWKEA